MLAVVTSSMMTTAKAWPNTEVVELPSDVGEKDFRTIGDAFSTVKPSLVVSCFLEQMIARGLAIYLVTFGCWICLCRQARL